MLYSFDDLCLKFGDYTDVKGKIRREIKAGNLTVVSRGLYETNSDASGKYLAGRIYGPSYLSFDYALAAYSLIPEAVYAFTSATFRKNKTKKYRNHFGVFTYRDVPAAAYPFEIALYEESGYSWQIATPEKALCDKLYSMPPVRNAGDLDAMLFDDLRIDERELRRLNADTINELAPLYRSTNLTLLTKFLRKKRL